jgi:hypothetical protein
MLKSPVVASLAVVSGVVVSLVVSGVVLLHTAVQAGVSDEDPLADIQITETAREKRERYLTPAQLRTALEEGSGYVCRKRSPNHEGLYDESKFLMRGTFFETELDIAFVVERDHIVVVTQMSQHSRSLRGRFYERVGTTAADAVAAVSD